MKAKKKPIETIKLDSLGIDFKSKLEVLKVENPVTRKGGVKVQSVDELIDKLRNEAKLF